MDAMFKPIFFASHKSIESQLESWQIFV